MKKVFHKLRDYVLALLTLMAMSASCGGLNTLNNLHFTEEGKLIQKPSFAKLDYNSDIHFYIESSLFLFSVVHLRTQPFSVDKAQIRHFPEDTQQ